MRTARRMWMCAVLLSARAPVAHAAAPEGGFGRDDPLTSPRTKWFREAKYGMFIHWGLYAVPAGFYQGRPVRGIGEWIMHRGRIPVSEYERFAAQFNPTRFDAREFARVARAAGMRYMVITSKHHDGFSMYETKVSGYNIVKATPYGRDPMKALAAACREAGIRFCFYYSIMDWHHPDANDRGAGRYIPQMKEQIRELITNYDPALLWFDGEWVRWWNQERGRELETFVRGLKPDIVVNNRIGKRKMTDGDYETPEQTIPAARIGSRLWETCMTLNNTWGYKRDDHNWKSSQDVVRKLCDIVSKGGNFLLNVGPDAEGVIPPASVRILEDAGAWVRENAEAIYATTYAPIPPPSWGRLTRKGDSIYAIVFDWPSEGRPLRLRLRNPIRRASVLATGARVHVVPRGEGGTDLVVTGPAPSRYASVIALEVEGALEPVKTLAEKTAEGIPIPAGADGSITLPAHGARLAGRTIRHEGPEEAGNIGFWTDRHDYVEWFIDPSPGAYSVQLTYACADGHGGEFVVAIGGEQLRGTIAPTGGWQRYADTDLGTVSLSAGTRSVAVKPEGAFRLALMNLRKITLRPVR